MLTDSHRDPDRPGDPPTGQVAGDAGQLTYSVEPGTVPCSVDPGRISVVRLVVTAANDTDAEVPCTRLIFHIPVGSGSDALTADPSTIGSAATETTPWAIHRVSEDTWAAVPLPPVTTLPPGGLASFALSGIVVNGTPGEVELSIEERTGTTTAGRAVVVKSGTATPGAPPRIVRFDATRERVAAGGLVTLHWQVTDADLLLLSPGTVELDDRDLPLGPVELPDRQSGSLPVTVPATTDFVLYAFSAGGEAQAATRVTVDPVEIVSFTADPPGPVAAGQPVTIRWETAFSAGCSISQGIGPVPGTGSRVVSPARSTTYTLTAHGLHTGTAAVTVAVT